MDYKSFLSNLAATDWSPETVRAYESDLRLFARYMADQKLRLSQITSRVISQYVEYLRCMPNPRFHKVGLSDSAISRRLAAISSYLEYIRETRNPKQRNPILARRRLTGKRSSPREPKAIDRSTVQALLSGVDCLRDRALFNLAVSAGLRVSELHRLDRDSVSIVEEEGNGEKRRVGKANVMGKGSKPRVVFFDVEALDAVADYLASRKDLEIPLFISSRKRRMSQRAIEERLDHWCRKLGIRHLNPHQFRHTFATELANGGLDAKILQNLMGHESFTTTSKYFQLSEKTKARSYFAAMELSRKA